MADAVFDNCLETPLKGLHARLGAKFVPFAGYVMPVQYPLGVLKEHLWTRAHAGLFDVSHMGQAFLKPKPGVDAAEAFETLVPGNIKGLKPGQQRYSMLLNEAGGIIDDLMVTRFAEDPETLYLVVNAACKTEDFALIREKLGEKLDLEILEDRALIALQGPDAFTALDAHVPGTAALAFMTSGVFEWNGHELFVSRSGYTGEDGYEISVPDKAVEAFAEALLADERVEAIGLGARDSLRLEAGLCLYGHDIGTDTSPVEAALTWALPKRRREEANFPGAARILDELERGPARVRVGILPDGRAPAREHTEITGPDGNAIGEVTSGGFGPSVNGPVAMGYVAAAFAAPGTKVNLMVRGKALGAEVVALPFVAKSYARKTA